MALKMFDYECNECGHTFEELTMTDDEVVACPKCGGSTSKLFTGCRVNGFNLLRPEDQKARMMKRSADHSASQLRKNGLNERSRENLRKV